MSLYLHMVKHDILNPESASVNWAVSPRQITSRPVSGNIEPKGYAEYQKKNALGLLRYSIAEFHGFEGPRGSLEDEILLAREPFLKSPARSIREQKALQWV